MRELAESWHLSEWPGAAAGRGGAFNIDSAVPTPPWTSLENLKNQGTPGDAQRNKGFLLHARTADNRTSTYSAVASARYVSSS